MNKIENSNIKGRKNCDDERHYDYDDDVNILQEDCRQKDVVDDDAISDVKRHQVCNENGVR